MRPIKLESKAKQTKTTKTDHMYRENGDSRSASAGKLSWHQKRLFEFFRFFLKLEKLNIGCCAVPTALWNYTDHGYQQLTCKIQIQ